MNWEGVTLRDYVETLLREGKRSKHEDFQALIRLFGEPKITAMAKDILAEWKAKKEVNDEN